jgi:hypothetical protein
MSVASHFAGKHSTVRATYQRLIDVARTLGPVTEEAKKTSIHLVRHTAFAGVATRRSSLILTLKSARTSAARELRSASRRPPTVGTSTYASRSRRTSTDSSPHGSRPPTSSRELDRDAECPPGRFAMPRVTLGVILGLSIGVADVLLMVPLAFPDKRTAHRQADLSSVSMV